MNEDEPRELTENEVRDIFLDQVWAIIDYWNRLAPKETSQRDRLSGLAFSLLVILDGGSCLPGFTVCPSPHPEDKEFMIDNEWNWYPENDCDIAGCLHDNLYKRDPYKV